MRRTGALLALSLLAGCGGAQTPPPPGEAATIVIPTAGAQPPPAEASAPPPVAAPPPPVVDPPAFTLPAPAACELHTARWVGKGAVSELRFREGGPVFARVSRAEARLVLPIGAAAQGAGLEIADSGLSLRGHIAGAMVGLYAAQALIFDGLAIPHARTMLSWSGAKAGDLGVTLDAIVGVAPTQTPLSATAPCSAFTLDPGSFDQSPALLGATSKQHALLRVGVPIALSVTPTGAPAAELRALDDADALVHVAEQSGPRSRIFWWRPEAWVFGWVQSRDLRPPPKNDVGFGTGRGSGSGFGRSVHPIDRVVCDRDVPVIAEAGGERRIVGSIAAGTTIDRLGRHGDHHEVWVRTGAVQIPPEARLLARAALLEGCEPRPL